MKIAISLSSQNKNAGFDPRFGRAAAFLLHDTESAYTEIIVNPALNATGGAGVQASQFLINQGIGAVVSGAFGPNAFKTLNAAGIKMYLVPSGADYDATEIIKRFVLGEFPETSEATAKGHH